MTDSTLISEFDVRVSKSRPTTPTKSSWFEFLLDPTCLHDHLTQPNPEPSATDLICQFLHNAEISVKEWHQKQINNAANEKLPSPDETPGEEPKQAVAETRKIKALRLLAVKTAAYLKWDLDILDANLPIFFVHNVLYSLVRCSQNDPPSVILHPQMDLSDLPNYSVFALQLYLRWCVRTVVKESFPTKIAKTSNITVPGLTEVVVPPVANEGVLRMIHEKAIDSATILEECLNVTNNLLLPSGECIGYLSEISESANHDWEKGIVISRKEIMCQLCYDLGTWNFSQENYSKAQQMFSKAEDLQRSLKESEYVRIDQNRLKGYLQACGVLKGVLPELDLRQLSLLERAECAKRNGFQGILEVLLEDNQKKELTLMYRSSLLDEIMKKPGLGKLYFEASTANMVRSVIEGRAVLNGYTSDIMDKTPEQIQFLVKVCEDGMVAASYSQRLNLKCFLRYICEVLPIESNFIPSLLSSRMKGYYTEEEIQELEFVLEDYENSRDITFDSEYSSESIMELPGGELSRQLIVSYDPGAIDTLIKRLNNHMTLPQIMQLCDKWWVPPEINQILATMRDFTAIFVYICVAKARHCTDLQIFEKSRTLLQGADAAVRDKVYKLSKLIRYEILLVDLQQFLETGTLPDNNSMSDVGKRCKTCITSLRIDSDIHPANDVITYCACFLINVADWDYLKNLTNTGNGFLELSRLLSECRKELQNIKSVRVPCKALWDTIVSIFLINTQQKRTSSGASNMYIRESAAGIISRAAFIEFAYKIKEPGCLSLLISCLTKIYSALKIELRCEITNEHLSLWPTTVQNPSDINCSAISEALSLVLQHSIQTFPRQALWLRTQADIYFANAQYSQALRFYLEAGVVASDFFTAVVPKQIYDDQVFKNMIKCCSYLQCHTQVAILCQFLDEVDYGTAFKALQEKICYDAMDTYYDCFWDMTILEFLTHLHSKRGEIEKRQKVLRAIGNMDLNSSNSDSILTEGSNIRKQQFLRTMAKQYL